MAWRKIEKAQGQKRVPVDVVTIRRQGIWLGVLFIAAHRLHEHRSCTPYVDDAHKLIALQFHEGPEGEFLVLRNGGATHVACTKALRELDVKPGKYSIKREAENYFVIDPKVPVVV